MAYVEHEELFNVMIITFWYKSVLHDCLMAHVSPPTLTHSLKIIQAANVFSIDCNACAEIQRQLSLLPSLFITKHSIHTLVVIEYYKLTTFQTEQIPQLSTTLTVTTRSNRRKQMAFYSLHFLHHEHNPYCLKSKVTALSHLINCLQ